MVNSWKKNLQGIKLQEKVLNRKKEQMEFFCARLGDGEAVQEILREVDKEVLEFSKFYAFMYNKVLAIDEPLIRSIFIDKYFNYCTFEEIAEKYDCSVRWVYKLHGKGLAYLESFCSSSL